MSASGQLAEGGMRASRQRAERGMSASSQRAERSTACLPCRRRSWLLSELSASLDYRASDRARLNELLALRDAELLQALAGRRRAELSSHYRELESAALTSAPFTQAICRHCDTYPSTLREDGAPWMLNVAGEGGCMGELASGAPVVAIVGSRRASDYGLEMARCLAQGLAASGVTVACGLGDGIAAAALAGSLEGGCPVLAVAGAGLGVCSTAKRRPLMERLRHGGCLLSELPHECRGRRWGAVAAERILARLARVVVVVEAEPREADLAVATLARSLGSTVAAMPGRLTSALSAGPHALLIDGASFVRGAGDVLELLCPPAACSQPSSRSTRSVATGMDSDQLEPRLAAVLEQVGAGLDTPRKLASVESDEGELLLALSELELMGLLGRGDGGRYVARGSLG